MERRTFLKYAAGLPMIAGCMERPQVQQKSGPASESMNLYWGDLHAHCNITYGHGSMKDALEAAVQQLDFCSIVAHALWPDIPREDPRIQEVIDYHLEAFDRIRQNWTQVQDLNLQYLKPGKFITILGYECHNMRDGDHNVYNVNPRASIVDALSIPDLKTNCGTPGHWTSRITWRT